LRETIKRLADEFDLSEEERKELLPSGSQATFDNCVGRARTYMQKAGLVESTRRGNFRITPKGLKALENPIINGMIVLGEEVERQGPFTVECSYCGAAPGFCCRKPSGQKYIGHRDRERKWRDRLLDSYYTVGIDWIRMQPPEVGRESREWIATYGKDSRERALRLAHLLTTAPEVTRGSERHALDVWVFDGEGHVVYSWWEERQKEQQERLKTSNWVRPDKRKGT
jgi:hypothetical protein